MAKEQVGKMPNLIYKFMCNWPLAVHPFVFSHFWFNNICLGAHLNTALSVRISHCRTKLVGHVCPHYLGHSMWFIDIYQISSILSWTITINHNQDLFVCCMVLMQNLLAQQEVIIRQI